VIERFRSIASAVATIAILVTIAYLLVMVLLPAALAASAA
jgi:hypothetical protein